MLKNLTNCLKIKVRELVLVGTIIKVYLFITLKIFGFTDFELLKV